MQRPRPIKSVLNPSDYEIDWLISLQSLIAHWSQLHFKKIFRNRFELKLNRLHAKDWTSLLNYKAFQNICFKCFLTPLHIYDPRSEEGRRHRTTCR